MEGAASPVSAGPARGLAAVRAVLGDIHFEQTLFSLPFVAVSALLAWRAQGPGSPWDWAACGWILLALVAARSCAMAANRWADAAFDARNPRTAGRAIPAGRVRRATMGGFALTCLAVFLFAAWCLNTLALALSPVALVFLVGYSWTKRITPLCHLVLGTAIGIAALGAWVGLRAGLGDATPWFLFGAVATWIAGFDVLYACPDVDVDRRDGLRSIPQTLGVGRAMRVSEALHVATVGLFAAAGALTPALGAGWWTGLALGCCVLVAEHRLVRPGDYRRMATAFFRLNAVFSVTLLASTLVDVLVLR
jgi:4-hydroxybenzoate polyprenyltransferase